MVKIGFIALLHFLWVIEIFGQNNYKLQSYSLQIFGTSTVHDWVVNSNKASGHAEIDVVSHQLKDIKSLMLEIPGNELKSEKKNNTMDQKIYDALKVESYLNITVKLKEIKSFPSEENGFSLNAVGVVTIAGFSREEDLIVQANVKSDGMVSFTGEKKLLMTDYKIKPPKAMVGMLKTGNEVTIKYELTMQKT